VAVGAAGSRNGGFGCVAGRGTTATVGGGGTGTGGGVDAGAAPAGVGVGAGGGTGAEVCLLGRFDSGTVPQGSRTLPAWTVTGSKADSPPAWIFTVVDPGL
jgi:hypothetical protein